MDLVRIGEKVVDRERIYRAVDRILELRATGLPQQEVADQLGIDRAFVSKVETMGEVRRGGRIALIGFPVKNKDEIGAIAAAEGLDTVLLMNDVERWEWVKGRSGEVLLADVMGLITTAKDCDAVIFIGSDMRIRLAEAILGPKVLGIEIGKSPIKEDKYVDPEKIRALIRGIKV
ncbi:MAG: transcriptional regulator [Ignavibacteriales bacterium]